MQKQKNYGTDRLILTDQSPVQEATHDSEQYDTPSKALQAEDWQFRTLPEVTYVYGIDWKCSGTITPQRLSIVQDAYNSARHQAIHALLNPPVQDLATEIQGLVHPLPWLLMTGNITNAECSHIQALPTHYMTAFCNHALQVTQERMASPRDFTPEPQEFWTAHPRDRVFGSRTDAFSSQFTGFSICHPMFHDEHISKVVQHATASALNNQEATTTLLRLPEWIKDSINAFHKTCTDSKDVCTILGNIRKTKVRYIATTKTVYKTPPLPEATWGIRIQVFWIKAAREQLITNNPSWL